MGWEKQRQAMCVRVVAAMCNVQCGGRSNARARACARRAQGIEEQGIEEQGIQDGSATRVRVCADAGEGACGWGREQIKQQRTRCTTRPRSGDALSPSPRAGAPLLACAGMYMAYAWHARALRAPYLTPANGIRLPVLDVWRMCGEARQRRKRGTVAREQRARTWAATRNACCAHPAAAGAHWHTGLTRLS